MQKKMADMMTEVRMSVYMWLEIASLDYVQEFA